MFGTCLTVLTSVMSDSRRIYLGAKSKAIRTCTQAVETSRLYAIADCFGLIIRWLSRATRRGGKV